MLASKAGADLPRRAGHAGGGERQAAGGSVSAYPPSARGAVCGAVYNATTTVLHRVLRYLLRVSAPRRSRLEWWDLIEIGLVALGFLLYFIVRGSVVDRAAEALGRARAIAELQAAVGLWVEPRLQAWALESDLLMRAMNLVYFWLDFPLIVGVGLLLFWRQRACYTLLRDSLLISGAIALILYWALPVAPPRFLTEWGFVDTMEQYSNLSYQAQSMRPFVNPFAAVPSLHVGWSALLTVAVFVATHNPLLRAASLVAFGLQSLSVLVTANHFLLDGVAGLVVAGIALALAVALQRRGYPGIRSVIQGLMRARASGADQGSVAGGL